MTDIEKRVRDGFSAIELPENLNKKTLQFIESQRETTATSQKPATSSTPPTPKVKAHRGRRWRVVASLAACLCLAFAGFGGYAYATPSAYVSVEAPVGLALRVNCFDIVVGVEGFDGNSLGVASLPVDVVGKSYADALDTLAKYYQDLPVAGDGAADSIFDISIVSDNQQQLQGLQQESEHCMSTHGMHGHCQSATQEERQAALEAGMGVARYLAAEELLALDSSLSLEDCQDMSMAELRERIAACGGDVPAPASGVGCGSGCSGSGDQEEFFESASSGHGNGHGRGNGAGHHGNHA